MLLSDLVSFTFSTIPICPFSFTCIYTTGWVLGTSIHLYELASARARALTGVQRSSLAILHARAEDLGGQRCSMHADQYAAALTAGWARRVSPLRARRPLRPYVRNVDVLRGQSQPAGRSSRLPPRPSFRDALAI